MGRFHSVTLDPKVTDKPWDTARSSSLVASRSSMGPDSKCVFDVDLLDWSTGWRRFFEFSHAQALPKYLEVMFTLERRWDKFLFAVVESHLCRLVSSCLETKVEQNGP